MKHIKLYEDFTNEATTSWKKMMQGVRASETGPWSIVAIQDRKVVGQSIDIRIQDLIPAKYEALKKEFPKAKLHIEDGTGMVVWNEGIERLHDAAGRYKNKLNEAKFKVGDKWEWHHVDGVKTVEITNVKSNGDVVGREDGSSEDFIVRDANKYLKKKVTESVINEARKQYKVMDVTVDGNPVIEFQNLNSKMKWIENNPDAIIQNIKTSSFDADQKRITGTSRGPFWIVIKPDFNESLVNEAKNLTREELVKILQTK